MVQKFLEQKQILVPRKTNFGSKKFKVLEKFEFRIFLFLPKYGCMENLVQKEILGVPREILDLVKCLIEHGAAFDIRNSNGETAFDLANKLENKEIAKFFMQKKRDSENKDPAKTISDKALCIICFEPRNGLHVLLPCGHTSLCELCCFNLKNEMYSKCPTCREPVKDYQKIFFQEAETEFTQKTATNNSK